MTTNVIPGRDVPDPELTPSTPPPPAAPPSPPPPPPGNDNLQIPGPYDTNLPGVGAGVVPPDGQLYRVGDTYMVVWEVAVPGAEPILIGYESTNLLELAGWYDIEVYEIPNYVDVEMTDDQWKAAGGIVKGEFTDISNSSQHPFEGWVDSYAEQAELYPWLLDGEVIAIMADAWLEGRTVEDWELKRTDWYKTHSTAERAWLLTVNSDPSTAEQTIENNRIKVHDMLQEAGVADAPEELVNWMADRFTRGEWLENQLTRQVRLVSDPHAEGQLDSDLQDFIDGIEGDLDTTAYREDTVKDLYYEWLGPVFGLPDQEVVDEWAGALRNDPDAEARLVEFLQDQRLAMFPGYKDRELSYQAIAQPWRSLMSSEWGQVPDESDPFFTRIVNMNDAAEAQAALRKEGLKRGVEQVTKNMVDDMASMFGGAIVRAR